MGSSQARAQTHVPCVGRRILNHWATRETPTFINWKSSVRKSCLFPPLICLSLLFISVRTPSYYFILWVIIQYCYLFYCSNCSSFGRWEFFQAGCGLSPVLKYGKGWGADVFRQSRHDVLIILGVSQVLRWKVSSGHWASLIHDRSQKPTPILKLKRAGITSWANSKSNGSWVCVAPFS